MTAYAKRDIDSEKFESYLAYVAAYNSWHKLEKERGAFDTLTQEAWSNLMLAEKRYKRMMKK